MPVSSTSSSFSSVYNKCLELESKLSELADKIDERLPGSGSVDNRVRSEIDNLSVTIQDIKETVTDLDVNTTKNIAAIADLKKKVSSVESAISTTKTITTKAVAVDDDCYTQVMTRLTDIEARVKAVEDIVGVHTEGIAMLNTKVDEVKASIPDVEPIKESIEAVQHVATTNTESINNNIANIAILDSKLTSATEEIGSVKETVSVANEAITSINAKLGTLPEDLSAETFADLISTAVEANITLEKATKNLNARVSVLESQTLDTSQIEANKLAIESMKSDVNNLTANVAVIDAQINGDGGIASTVAANKSSIETLKEYVIRVNKVINGKEVLPTIEEVEALVQSIKDIIAVVKAADLPNITKEIAAAKQAAEDAAKLAASNLELVKKIISFCGSLENFKFAVLADDAVSITLPGVYDVDTEKDTVKLYDKVVDENGVIYLPNFELGRKESAYRHGRQVRDSEELCVYSVLTGTQYLNVEIPKYIVIISGESFKAYRIRTFFPILKKYDDVDGMYCNKFIKSIKMDWIEKLVNVDNFCANNDNQPMISLPRCEEIRYCNYFGAGRNFGNETYLEIPISCKLLPSESSEDMRHAWNVLNIMNQFNSFMGCIWAFSNIDRNLRNDGITDVRNRNTIYGDETYLKIDMEHNENMSKRAFAFRAPEKRSSITPDNGIQIDLFNIPDETLALLDRYAVTYPIVDGILPSESQSGIESFMDDVVSALKARRNGMQVDIGKINPVALPFTNSIDQEDRVISSITKPAVYTVPTTATTDSYKFTIPAVDPNWNLRDRISSFCQSTCNGLAMFLRQIHQNEDLKNTVFKADRPNPLRFVVEALEAIIGNVSNVSTEADDDQQFSNINSNYMLDATEDDKGAHTLFSYFAAMIGVSTTRTKQSAAANNTIYGTAGLYFDNYMAENAVNSAGQILSANLNGTALQTVSPITEEYSEGAARSKHTDIYGIPRAGQNVVIPPTMKYGYEYQSHKKVIKYFSSYYNSVSGEFIKKYEELLNLVESSFMIDPAMREYATQILSNRNNGELEAWRSIWAAFNYSGAYAGTSIENWYHPATSEGATEAGITLPAREKFAMVSDGAMPFNVKGPISSMVYATNKAIVVGSIFNKFVQMFEILMDIMTHEVVDSELTALIEDEHIQIASKNNNDGFYEGLVLSTMSEKLFAGLVKIAYANYPVLADPVESIVDGSNKFNNIKSLISNIDEILNADNKWLNRFSDNLENYVNSENNLKDTIKEIRDAIDNVASEYLINTTTRSDQGGATYFIPEFYAQAIDENAANDSEIFGPLNDKWTEVVPTGSEVDTSKYKYYYVTDRQEGPLLDTDGIVTKFNHPVFRTLVRVYNQSSSGVSTEVNRFLFFTTDPVAGFYFDINTMTVEIKRDDENGFSYSSQVGYRYALAKYTNKNGKKWTAQYPAYYLASYNKMRNIDNVEFVLKDGYTLGDIVSNAILPNERIAYKSTIPTIFGDGVILNLARLNNNLRTMYLGKHNIPIGRMTHWFQSMQTVQPGIDSKSAIYTTLIKFAKNILSCKLYQSAALANPLNSIGAISVSFVVLNALLFDKNAAIDEELKNGMDAVLEQFYDALEPLLDALDSRESLPYYFNNFETVAQQCITQATKIAKEFNVEPIPGSNYVHYLQNTYGELYNLLMTYDGVQTTNEENGTVTNWMVPIEGEAEQISKNYARFMVAIIASFYTLASMEAQVYNKQNMCFNNEIIDQALANAHQWKLIAKSYVDSSNVTRFQKSYNYVNPDTSESQSIDIDFLSGEEMKYLFNNIRKNRITVKDILSNNDLELLNRKCQELCQATSYSTTTATMLHDNYLRVAGNILSEIGFHVEYAYTKTYLRYIKFLPSTTTSLIGESSAYAIDGSTSYVPPTYTKDMKVYYEALNTSPSASNLDENAVYKSDEGNKIHEFNIYLPASVLHYDSFVGEVKYNNKIISVSEDGEWNVDSVVVNSFLPSNCGCKAVEPFGANGANAHTKLSNPESSFVGMSRVMSHEFNGIPVDGSISTIDQTHSDKYYGLWPATELNQTPAHTEDGAIYPFFTQKQRCEGISLNEALKIWNQNFLVGRDRIIPRLNEEGMPENSTVDDETRRDMTQHFALINGTNPRDNFETTLVAATSLTTPSVEGKTYSEYMPCNWDSGNYRGIYLRAPTVAGGAVQDLDNDSVYGDYTFDDTEWFYNADKKTYNFAGEAFHGVYERHYRFY